MKTTHYTVTANLSKDYRIALLADLHGKVPRGLLSTITEAKPDLIAIAGDLLDGMLADAPHMLPFLAELVHIAPTFYSRGNHEHYTEKDRKSIESAGVVYLTDDFYPMGELLLGGLSSGIKEEKHRRTEKTPPPSLDFITMYKVTEGYKILLCHHPEYYEPYIKPTGIELTLSGHAHGGQWRFFGRGVFAPGQGLFPRYTSGVHENRLVISRGLGSHTPIPRIFNPEELVIIDIKS